MTDETTRVPSGTGEMHTYPTGDGNTRITASCLLSNAIHPTLFGTHAPHLSSSGMTCIMGAFFYAPNALCGREMPQ
jgi:hypothetical protein